MIQMDYMTGSTNGSEHMCELSPLEVRGNIILFHKQLRTQQGGHSDKGRTAVQNVLSHRMSMKKSLLARLG